MTKSETEMAARIAKRAANAVKQGAMHLDAITTQMQASGIDPDDVCYNSVGRVALSLMLEEVPLHTARPARGAHSDGWLEFVASGQPASGGNLADNTGEPDELEGFQVRESHK